MHTILAVIADIASYFNPRTKNGLIRLGVLALIAVVALRFIGSTGESSPEAATPLPVVTQSTVADFSGAGTFTVIGTVEAVDEAALQTEVGGRVTAVNVTIGDSIAAGTVIATLENASQRAAVLQAEGAYEAAIAGAAASDVGVGSAEAGLNAARNQAVTAYQNAFSTVSGTLYNAVDTIYSDPEGSLPGVRIDGGSDTPYLNSTRITLQSTIPDWRATASRITTNDNLDARLPEALTNVDTMLTLVDTVIRALSANPSDYAGTEFANLRTTLINERTALTNTRANLLNAQTTLTQAEDALAQASLGGTSGEVSAANAQVKQALGVLRAAEANLAKTIIRTPISGVVNSVTIDAGDFVGPQTPVATIANNDALIITAFVGESDRERITQGQAVTIAGEYPGTITAIAPAVDPVTGKVEVQIETATSELANGDTVRIAVTSDSVTETTDAPTALLVPLTAVKFTATAGTMFTVTDSKLVGIPVTTGRISGSFVEITSGIDASTAFVVDARGLSEGRAVEVATQD